MILLPALFLPKTSFTNIKHALNRYIAEKEVERAHKILIGNTLVA